MPGQHAFIWLLQYINMQHSACFSPHITSGNSSILCFMFTSRLSTGTCISITSGSLSQPQHHIITLCLLRFITFGSLTPHNNLNHQPQHYISPHYLTEKSHSCISLTAQNSQATYRIHVSLYSGD